MYAIFEDGSRHYWAEQGKELTVDFREGELGSRVEFPNVLLFQTGTEARIGQPTVAGAKVVAEVVGFPSEKTYIQKFRRRKNYRRFTGHRQKFIKVRVTEVLLAGWQPPVKEEGPQETPQEATN